MLRYKRETAPHDIGRAARTGDVEDSTQSRSQRSQRSQRCERLGRRAIVTLAVRLP